MFIPSDTSDISDWSRGAFPHFSNHFFHETSTSSLDPQTPKDEANINSEILDEQPQTVDPLECPISILPAGHKKGN